MGIKEALKHLPDEVIWQLITMEIDQILQHLPDCPEQHPRSLRRLNWVEWKWDNEKLRARMNREKDMTMVWKQAYDDIRRALIDGSDHLKVLRTWLLILPKGNWDGWSIW